ncbi:alanine racemase [Rhizobium sp. BIGb0125]|uniref:alanine racemase n=1 Tax=Rhizobium sp. BIGb0125 TaxID=2940618 RepID=UPI0021696DDE|nr:alanine racemase [Rhizobium sp. BIGb0125]MCS4243499.1 alanine racemase [Rhizobium sp. BIGb0125]
MNMQISRTHASGNASGWLTIDLGALFDNYRFLQTQAPASAVAGVVKADAYGLGADHVATTLYAAGCRDFFVAHIDEAISLRKLIAQDARFYVLNGLQPGNEASCEAFDITPVLNSLAQVAQWSDFATSIGKTLPAILQVDTGMCRLGLPPEELEILVKDQSRVSGLRIDYIMSHLACADEPENLANAAQLTVMLEAALGLPNAKICFSNSGGIFLGSGYHNHLMRPGIALYGGAPSVVPPNPMKPVVGLQVAVVQTRIVPAGSQVGYGGSFVSKEEMRLATLAAGYADGLPRSLSNSGAVWFNGQRLPIVGRVSMDSIIVDISALPEGTLQHGSLVEVIGPQQSLEDVADDAGTIAYEILTSLGRRYQRKYIQPRDAAAALTDRAPNA